MERFLIMKRENDENVGYEGDRDRGGRGDGEKGD